MTATPQPECCVICGEPTDSTVRARIGESEGAACTDCQFFCDGNLIAVSS